MVNYLTLPDGTRLVVGNLVTIDGYENIRWIVQNGWHSYNNKYYKGWYFSSIPDQEILPENCVDLEKVHLLSTIVDAEDFSVPINTNPSAELTYSGNIEDLLPDAERDSDSEDKPGPWPGPHNPLFPPVASDPESVPYYVAQAFITVQNLEERDELKTKKLPHGKLVRVNDVEGNIEYYEWSSTEQKWLHANLLVESRIVTAGDGLSGGGSLEQDITISHGDTGTGEDHTYEVDSDSDTIDVISGISVDKFGHTVGIVERDITETVIEVAKSVAPRWHLIEEPDSDSDSE